MDGVPTYAVVQDLIPQHNILAQALQEVGNSPDTPSATPTSSLESLETFETEDDTLATGAERILKWLKAQDIPTDSEPTDDDGQNDDDTRRSAARPAGAPYRPVRQSLPPPSVDWQSLGETIGYHPPADPSSLHITCAKPSVVNNQAPKEDQLPVVRQAVASMLTSGVIEETVRGPYLNPIQVVPKNEDESRFELNCAALTPHLKAPKFQLPSFAGCGANQSASEENILYEIGPG